MCFFNKQILSRYLTRTLFSPIKRGSTTSFPDEKSSTRVSTNDLTSSRNRWNAPKSLTTLGFFFILHDLERPVLDAAALPERFPVAFRSYQLRSTGRKPIAGGFIWMNYPPIGEQKGERKMVLNDFIPHLHPYPVLFIHASIIIYSSVFLFISLSTPLSPSM